MKDESLGLSIRMVRKFDIDADKLPARVDMLVGYASLRPDLACRVQSEEVHPTVVAVRQLRRKAMRAAAR